MIKDLFNCVQKDKIKIIPLNENQKTPLHKGFWDKKYTIKELNDHTGNYGVCVGYNHNHNNGQSIAVIDIDGIKGDYEQESKLLLFNLLKPVFQDCMMVRSQSGGYHIYCWNKTILKDYYSYTKDLCFPKDCDIPELAGVPIYHGIELFTRWKTKFVVLPGSIYKDEDTGKIGKYSIINKKYNFHDIGVVDNVGELVRETLLDNGFTVQEKPTNTHHIPQNIDKKDFKPEEIKQLLNILTPGFRKLEGMRQDSYMALGGYLVQYMEQELVERIVYALAQSCGDDELNKRLGTVKRNIEFDGAKTGLPTLLNNLNSVGVYTEPIEFLIRKLVQPMFNHEILVTEGYTKRTLINIDYTNSCISEVIYSKSQGKKETEPSFKWSSTEHLLNLRPDRIFESYNILDRNAPPKLCFTFYRKGMPNSKTLMGDNIQNIENTLQTFPGVVLRPRKYKGVINTLITEYERLGLLGQEFNAPVTGLFINPKNGELCCSVHSSFDCEDTGLIDIEENKPSKKQVYEAFSILEKLGGVYKGPLDVLGSVASWFLLVPFSYILKTNYRWLPMIYLFGPSDTNKTSICNIFTNFYSPVTTKNNVGGSSAKAVYPLGKLYSESSFGCVINEPGNIFRNDELVDMLKNGVESPICRDKGNLNKLDGHERVPAYNNFAWTSNTYAPSQDAFVKRCLIYELSIKGQVSKEDKEEFNRVFNHVNWNNTDFLKLKSIGDYIIWFVHENMNVLSTSWEELADKFWNELYDYSGYDCVDWLHYRAVPKSFQDSHQDILNTLREMILSDYKRLPYHRKLNNINDLIKDECEGLDMNLLESMGVTVYGDFDNKDHLFINGIVEGYFSYLFLNKNRNGELFVGFRTTVKDSLKKFSNGVLQVNWKSLAELIPESIVKKSGFKIIKTRNNAKGFIIPYNTFKELIL